VVVVASYRPLSPNPFFIYTEIKKPTRSGPFAGRVKYSRVLVCATVLRALPPAAPSVLERPPQRYSHQLKLAESTSPRGLTNHCTNKVRYIKPSPLYICRKVFLLLKQFRGAGFGELQRARGRSERTRPHPACFARRPRLALFISPTHKRTEGRAPVWALSLLQKDAALQGGSSRNRCTGWTRSKQEQL
jgi:hypothetical protein